MAMQLEAKSKARDRTMNRVHNWPVVATAELLSDEGSGPVKVKFDCEDTKYGILDGTPFEAWASVVAVLLEYYPETSDGGTNELDERRGAAGVHCMSHCPNTRRADLEMEAFRGNA